MATRKGGKEARPLSEPSCQREERSFLLDESAASLIASRSRTRPLKRALFDERASFAGTEGTDATQGGGA